MKKLIPLLILLMAFLILSLFIGINLGYAKIPSREIKDVLAFKIGIKEAIPDIRDSTVDIIYLIRLPRLILAIIVGMSLAVAGVVMQAIVRNPIADPYILGISSGASLGATLSIVVGIAGVFGRNATGFSAFLMAFIVSLAVVFLANIGGRANSTKLLLSGMALSTVSSSISSLLVYLSSNRDAARELSFWLLGSLAGAKWTDIVIIGPIIFLSSLFFLTQYRTLNLMLLGDEVAITMGKDLNISRHIYLLITSLMIGFVVYVSGVIGFIGLIVPHIARMIVGTDHKQLIPLTMLMGSILLLWADILSRIIIPGSELPTGIIISVLGAPLFIYLIVSRSYKGGGR